MRYSPRQLSVGAIVALLLSLAVGLSHAGVLFRRAAFEVVRASATIAASAPTVTCTQPPPLKPCINFWVNASKLYPFLVQDSVLNMAQQAQPFQFALPARLPVTRGNSGNYLSTITIDSATVMSSGGNDNAIGIFVSQVVCQYKGTGVQNPQLPEEITAAQNYAFQSCSPSNLGLQAGDELSALNGAGGGVVRVHVSDGGSQNSLDRVSVGLWINQTTPCTEGNVPVTPPPVCSTVTPGGTTKTSTATGGGMQPSSSNVLNNGGDGGKQSAGMGSALFYGIVSGAVLLAVASIAFGMLVLRRQRRHKANLKAQALSGSLDGTFFSSDTSKNPLPALLPTTSYSRDYDEIFHTNMAIEEDLEEGNVNDGEIDSTVPDMVHGRAQSIGAGIITANRKSLALSRGSRGSVAYGRDRVGSLPIHTLTANTMMEPTLLNTQAGLSIPGFLMINFSNDLRLEKTIAEGGAGIIYQAEMLDESLRRKYRVRRVVAKVMKMNDSWSAEEQLTIFRQEVSIMWSLAFHKNIIKLIGFCENPYCVVTKMYSQNLGSVIMDIEHFELFPEITVSFAADICAGMTEMHSLGIAHRDLKSSNCLIEKLRTHPFPTYNVVICDFGLSRVDSDVAAAIKGWKQSVVAGISVRYAAPEVFARLHVSQANKRSSRIADASLGGAGTAQPVVDVEAKPIAMASSSIHEDKSGDIYAYAIIMWELLERKIPWADLNNDEIEFAVRQGKRPHFNGNESLGVMENGDAADGDIADEEVEGEGRATDDRNDKHRRNHTRQSTVRTTASSILTSFKRFTFAKRPQENFDADAFMRENLTEIMVASWDQEPHVRPAFAEIKTKLALLLERLQRNAEVTE